MFAGNAARRPFSPVLPAHGPLTHPGKARRKGVACRATRPRTGGVAPRNAPLNRPRIEGCCAANAPSIRGCCAAQRALDSGVFRRERALGARVLRENAPRFGGVARATGDDRVRVATGQGGSGAASGLDQLAAGGLSDSTEACHHDPWDCPVSDGIGASDGAATATGKSSMAFEEVAMR